MKKKTCQIVVSEVDDEGIVELEKLDVSIEQIRVLVCATSGLELRPGDHEIAFPLIVGLLRHWKIEVATLAPDDPKE